MYYPKQIPYLLDKIFKDNVKYTEYHFEELENYCMCIWKMQSKEILDKPIYNYILPDACIDIIIDFTKKEIIFAGFSKETEILTLKDKVDYLGVRLKPGAFYSIYKMEADKIMDKGLSFAELEKEKTLNKILLCEEKERISIFKNYLEEKVKEADNRDFIKFVDELHDNPTEQTVMKVANELNYNERQLFRIFKKHYGISPKVLLNIIRLHFCLEHLLENKEKMVEIANICGFYDQAHFIKEIKRYTGISPIQLLENYKQ